jgi:Transcriptional regulator C-terminal region/Bacterial regulatory proteins, tetR family
MLFVTGQNGWKVRKLMETIDRRIQKTKKILSEALIALILEKGYEQITVQDIIDKANVGRSTFYSHYEGKDQLLLAGPENLGVRFFETTPMQKGVKDNATPSFMPLFQHAEKNLALAKAMLGRKSGNIMFGHLQNRLSDMILEQFKSRFGKTKQDKVELRYCSTAAAAAVMGFLISWLEEDIKAPAEDIAGLCERSVSGLFAGALGKSK